LKLKLEIIRNITKNIVVWVVLLMEECTDNLRSKATTKLGSNSLKEGWGSSWNSIPKQISVYLYFLIALILIGRENMRFLGFG